MSKSGKFAFAFCAIFIVFGLFACNKPQESGQKSASTYDISIGKAVLNAKIMITPQERARGLMFVKSIPENFGMIFVAERPEKASFWMKNTEIPLDLGFFDSNGFLTEVKSLYPFNLDSVQSSRSDILYCVETNAGWFKKNNIKAGDSLDIDALRAAISRRKGTSNALN